MSWQSCRLSSSSGTTQRSNERSNRKPTRTERSHRKARTLRYSVLRSPANLPCNQLKFSLLHPTYAPAPFVAATHCAQGCLTRLSNQLVRQTASISPPGAALRAATCDMALSCIKFAGVLLFLLVTAALQPEGALQMIRWKLTQRLLACNGRGHSLPC